VELGASTGHEKPKTQERPRAISCSRRGPSRFLPDFSESHAVFNHPPLSSRTRDPTAPCNTSA